MPSIRPSNPPCAPWISEPCAMKRMKIRLCMGSVRQIPAAWDRKAGVIWHTQGSGKSLSMVFYTGKIVLTLDNPTVLVITDRNDLDDQLFDTFAASKQLLRQDPVQAQNREHLKSCSRWLPAGWSSPPFRNSSPKRAMSMNCSPAQEYHRHCRRSPPYPVRLQRSHYRREE